MIPADIQAILTGNLPDDYAIKKRHANTYNDNELE